MGCLRSLLAGLVLLSGSLSAAQPSGAVLSVATMVWPPFRMSSPGAHLSGLDVDLLNEISRRTGLQFDIQVMPWARGLERMRQGHVDLMTGLARTLEREAYVEYLSPPYHACAPRFYGSAVLQGQVRDYGDLSRLRIGYVLESAYFEPFDSDTRLNKRGVNSESQLLEMLQRGRIDLLVGTDCQVDYDRRDPALAQRLFKMSYEPPNRTALYIGFSRKSPQQAARTLMETALQSIVADGWLQHRARIYWGGR